MVQCVTMSVLQQLLYMSVFIWKITFKLLVIVVYLAVHPGTLCFLYI